MIRVNLENLGASTYSITSAFFRREKNTKTILCVFQNPSDRRLVERTL